jgi:uncharacterized membrane protein YfbV (UPF0208 family)
MVMAEVRNQLIREAQEQIISESPEAVDAIADLVNSSPQALCVSAAGDHHSPRIEAEMAPSDIWERLSKIDIDLSIVNDQHRNRDWGDLLRRAPRVIGEMVALAGFDPWRSETTTRSDPRSAATQRADAERAVKRMNRVGTLVDGVAKLAVPFAVIPRLVRFVLLPALMVFGLWGMFAAFGPGTGRAVLTFVLALSVGGAAIAWVGSRSITGASRPARVARAAMTVIGYLMVAAGLILPALKSESVRGRIDDPTRAALYTCQAFVAIGGAVVTLMFGAVRSRRWRAAIGVACVAIGIGCTVGAVIADPAATALLIGSLLITVVGVAAFVGLSMLQGAIYSAAEPKPEPGAERGRPVARAARSRGSQT